MPPQIAISKLPNHVIGMVVFPGFQSLDAAGPASVFEAASYFSTAGGYELKLLSAAGGLTESSFGTRIHTSAMQEIDSVDSLVVIGGQGTRKAVVDSVLIEHLRRLGSGCTRLASICTGTFVLAAAGLIRDCKVTTHWRHSQRLVNQFPDLKVVPDQIWIKDGKVWSSAGVSAGIDLALAMVAEDKGAKVAQQCAREIVVYYQRPGGQSQFSTIEDLSERDDRFRSVLVWIREHIARPIKVEDLAAVAAMSPRNFSRQFLKSVGRTPAKAVEQIRVETAKRLVESSELQLDQIAQRCGFSDGEIMRRAFVRLFGQAPRAMRTQNKDLQRLR